MLRQHHSPASAADLGQQVPTYKSVGMNGSHLPPCPLLPWQIWGNGTWAPDDTKEMRKMGRTFGAFLTSAPLKDGVAAATEERRRQEELRQQAFRQVRAVHARAASRASHMAAAARLRQGLKEPIHTAGGGRYIG